MYIGMERTLREAPHGSGTDSTSKQTDYNYDYSSRQSVTRFIYRI